jgi:PAS domain S-box-containing protein
MNPILDGLITTHFAEHVILDGGFSVRSYTTGAPDYAFDGGALAGGRDVRDAFPELVGAEVELHELMLGRSPEWSLHGIDRTDQRGIPFYINIVVRPRMGLGNTSRILEILLADVTEVMLQLRNITQTANSTTLLLSALASSKVYVESILDSMVDPLFVASSAGTIKMANRAAAHLLGFPADQLIGKPVQQFLQQLPLGIVGQVLNNIEVTCRSKDGEEVPMLFSFSPIQAEGDPGVVCVGRDLRATRRVEATIHRLQKENIYLQEEVNAEHNFEEMIGTSPGMQEVFRKIQQVSATDSTVLLQGETGTGKELIARALHNLSPRREKVLVKVNCAALPSGLVESELFGHEKGAFTGATARKIGRFELAHEGTILLDEVSELPLEAQSKLLRVLQEREFERVGGTQTLKVDSRVVASTNRNLLEAVQMGAFREDLFYRLNVFPIVIPPLRLRGEDIPLLSYYFVERFARKMHKRIEGVSQPCMHRLRNYRWPGNVRELASVIERAVILCEGNTLEEVDVPVGGPAALQDNLNLDHLQRQHILDVLDQCGGTIEGPRGAAARLGINPATLRSRLKKLGIVRKEKMFVLHDRP